MINGLLSGGYLAGVFATVIVTMFRLAGFLYGLPPLSGAAIPARVRAGFLLHTALVVSAARGFPADALGPSGYPDAALTVGLVIALEFSLGLALGMIVRVVFAGAEAFGHIASYSLGLGFAIQVDPSTGSNSTMLARLTMVATGMLLFTTDIHLALLGAVFQTFEVWPAGQAPAILVGGLGIARQGALMFDLGFQLAGPIVAIGLMTYLVLAVITKVSPQLNLFAIGFALLIPSGLVVLLAQVPDMVALLASELSLLPDRFALFLRTGVGP